MQSPILVTGGTGTLGRLLTPLLRDAGQTVRVLTRRARDESDGIEYVTGDLATGEGIEEAVAGVNTIVHCAGAAKGDAEKTRNLVQAVSRTGGGPHLVYISVVGTDRLPVESAIDRAMFGYFAEKKAAERILAESGLPWTILRATQFHDFVLTALGQMAKVPVVMPTFAGVRFQPVDARDVATRLVELALGEPSGLVPDIAGPQVYAMDDLARDYLRAAGKRRMITPLRTPGRASAAYRDGANLTSDAVTGHRTWEEFLAERLPSASLPSM